MHVGTERGLINKHVRWRNEVAGEYVMWYQYSPSPVSSYDDVYDEGGPGISGRVFLDPVKVPTIYAEESEDSFVLREDGRKPTQNVMFTILLRDAEVCGVISPGEYGPHLNDVLSYDDRFYKVANYRVGGRLKGEIIIKIAGYEVFMDEEFVFDQRINTLTDDVWPSTFPSL